MHIYIYIDTRELQLVFYQYILSLCISSYIILAEGPGVARGRKKFEKKLFSKHFKNKKIKLEKIFLIFFSL